MRQALVYFSIVVVTTLSVIAALFGLGLLRIGPPEAQESQEAAPALQPLEPTGASAVRGWTGDTEVSFAPLPDFVAPVSFDPDAEPAFEPTGGVRVLLVDSQASAAGAQPVVYNRLIYQIESRGGATALAQLPIPFHPDYQRLRLHHAQVRRDGEWSDRQELTQVDILREETRRFEGVLTGLATALVRVEDLSPGDMLELAWSVTGDHPALDGEFSLIAELSIAGDAEQISARFVLPRGRGDVHSLGGAPEPALERKRNLDIYTIAPGPSRQVELEFAAPAEFVQTPLLLATSFKDWSDVGEWAAPLFADRQPNAEVREIASRIRFEHALPGERAAAAIEFVQDEIQYFAIALGSAGLVPATIEETLRTRSGDCKAKSLLLAVLFNELGFEADIALVNAGSGRGLPDMPPTAALFDHMVVRLHIGDASFWIDPTISLQRGGLYHRHQPDYGWALVLDDPEAGLVSMTADTAGALAYADIAESIDARYAPMLPADLLLDITYRGPLADTMRAWVEGLTENQIKEQFENALAQRYGQVELYELSMEDYAPTNAFTFSGRAAIRDFFGVADGEGRRWRRLRPQFSESMLTSTNIESRYPVIVVHPNRVRQEIEVRLPGESDHWDFELEPVRGENAAFSFARTASYEDNLLTVSWEATSHQPSIRLTEALVSDQRRMREAWRYPISLNALEEYAPVLVDPP
ncbi:MAG: DUF3857 domain-containing protein [Pseudomonadota bacterium]